MILVAFAALVSQTPSVEGGLLVLKIARSGSSWFADSLNQVAGVAFVEEGITHSAGGLFSVGKKESYLRDALQMPIGKIKSYHGKNKMQMLRVHFSEHSVNRNTRKLLDARVNESDNRKSHRPSYMRSIKDHGTQQLLRKIMVVGVSISAIGNVDLGFKNILRHGQNKLLMYIRSNVVKLGLASLRGKLFRSACGHPNIRDGDLDHCASKLPHMVDSTVGELMWGIASKVIQNEILVATANKPQVPYHTVMYEELQLDRESVLNNVTTFMGSIWSTLHRVSGATKFTKSTGEDLRTVITRYDELLKYLQAKRADVNTHAYGQHRHVAYNCLLRMLKSDAPEVFQECTPTPDGGGLRLVNMGLHMDAGFKEHYLKDLLDSDELSRIFGVGINGSYFETPVAKHVNKSSGRSFLL
jgi:hypothetical protein